MVKDFVSLYPRLVKWYELNHRALPWRKDPPLPYEVWISEVMSQQSTMPTIVRYFERWLHRFPTFESFSHATEAEVLSLWAGLGYYSRARNLFKAKEQLKTFIQTQGRWPNTQLEWQSLPGVGPYTAGAVASMAFQDSVLPADGNIFRVLARFWNISDPINSSTDRKALLERWLECSKSLPKGTHGAVTQAMMELGALVCRPQAQALCEACPLATKCLAYKNATQALIPKAKNRKTNIKINVLALIYHHPKDPQKVLLRNIPQGKRLAGQWELPLWELQKEEHPLLENLSELFETRKPVKHSITHHQYTVYGVQAGPWQGEVPENHCYWQSGDLEGPGVLSTLTKKILLL